VFRRTRYALSRLAYEAYQAVLDLRLWLPWRQLQRSYVPDGRGAIHWESQSQMVTEPIRGRPTTIYDSFICSNRQLSNPLLNVGFETQVLKLFGVSGNEAATFQSY